MTSLLDQLGSSPKPVWTGHFLHEAQDYGTISNLKKNFEWRYQAPGKVYIGSINFNNGW